MPIENNVLFHRQVVLPKTRSDIQKMIQFLLLLETDVMTANALNKAQKLGTI